MSIFTEARELKNKGNETKAVSMFEKGFAGGNPMCGYGLAVCCKYGDGIEKDEGKAEKLFISSLPKIRALAENGDPEAETVIGFYYYNGFTVETDEAEAFAWFQKAAEQGYTSAQNSLAWCYENGKGVEQDYEKAV